MDVKMHHAEGAEIMRRGLRTPHGGARNVQNQVSKRGGGVSITFESNARLPQHREDRSRCESGSRVETRVNVDAWRCILERMNIGQGRRSPQTLPGGSDSNYEGDG